MDRELRPLGPKLEHKRKNGPGTPSPRSKTRAKKKKMNHELRPLGPKQHYGNQHRKQTGHLHRQNIRKNQSCHRDGDPLYADRAYSGHFGVGSGSASFRYGADRFALYRPSTLDSVFLLGDGRYHGHACNDIRCKIQNPQGEKMRVRRGLFVHFGLCVLPA